MKRTYQHFCPVARALEKIGDRWSLLIVRDLLRRPQRFTDLLRSSSNITPKWLSRRLGELEAAGIVERDSQLGRREVWYRLTPTGRDLGPVVRALASWGLEHAMRPPLPGEAIHPGLLMNMVALSLNRWGKRLSRPVTWSLRFTPGGPYTLSFDGERWSSQRGEEANADVTLTTTPEACATFVTAEWDERGQYAERFQLDGTPDRVEELLQTLSIRSDQAE